MDKKIFETEVKKIVEISKEYGAEKIKPEEIKK